MRGAAVLLVIVALLLVGCLGFRLLTQEGVNQEEEEPTIKPNQESAMNEVTLITVYDNYQFDPKLKTGHGFSCLVRLKEQTILFDTGADSQTLLGNMEKLGIKPGEIDSVVLSHIHGDHTDGLWGLLEENSQIKVYLPASFPNSFREKISSYNASHQDVGEAAQLMEGVYSTGELGTVIKEQALVVGTGKGLVVLTGCAHPGVVKMVRKAKELVGEDLYLVMGGFHLGAASDAVIEEIIKAFGKLGVDKVGPCHCSGTQARQLFKQSFGKDYVGNGVGRIINL